VKRPVWSLELIRDTDAPMDVVVRVLSDGAAFHRWHPRLKAVDLDIRECDPSSFKADYASCPCLGVEERGVFEVHPEGERLILVHRIAFKGWPVLLLMGWWRVRSHRMWERLVESL
jgi:hypothetical protein